VHFTLRMFTRRERAEAVQGRIVEMDTEMERLVMFREIVEASDELVWGEGEREAALERNRRDVESIKRNLERERAMLRARERLRF